MWISARFLGALQSDDGSRGAPARPHWADHNVHDRLGSMFLLVFWSRYLGDDDQAVKRTLDVA